MRWLKSLLPLTLLSLSTPILAAKKDAATEDRFKTWHSKALSSAPVKLDDAKYKDLTKTPRDYAVAVLLTAMEPRFGCQLCREFQPEWDLLGRSWTRGDKSGASRLVYGTLDFAEGRDTFMSMGLQTAPVLLLFPPTAGPHASQSPDPLRFDFNAGASKAEVVHDWIARNLPDRPHPTFNRPINWLRVGATIVIVLGSITGAFVAWPYALPIIQNRNVWAAVSLIAILLFISGHMFNHIRHVPYVQGDGHGGINYFAGGFQNQFGLETQIVAAIYGVLSFCTIALAVKVPRIEDKKTQQAAVIGWGGLLFVMYSFLLSAFRIKNGGYPFSLPPFM